MRLILGYLQLASVIIYLPSVFALEKDCMLYTGLYNNGTIHRDRELSSFACPDDQCSFLMRITNKAAKQAEFRLGCGNLTEPISGDRCARSKDGLEFFCVCEGDKCLGMGFIQKALDKFVLTGTVSIDVSNRRLGKNGPGGPPLEEDGGNGGGKDTSNGSGDAGIPSGGSPGTGGVPQDTPGGGNAGGYQPTSHGSAVFVTTTFILFIVAALVLV